MRPPHAAAEKGNRFDEDRPQAHASMRPPHAAAEKIKSEIGIEITARASMRPPHAAAEKVRAVHPPENRASGFNEAAARGGGKARGAQ